MHSLTLSRLSGSHPRLINQDSNSRSSVTAAVLWNTVKKLTEWLTQLHSGRTVVNIKWVCRWWIARPTCHRIVCTTITPADAMLQSCALEDYFVGAFFAYKHTLRKQSILEELGKVIFDSSGYLFLCSK